MKTDQERKSTPSTMSLIATVVVHILLLAPVIYIVALYSEQYSFFSWHPICMSIGVGLLIIEGVFCISGEANLTNRLSRANRVTLHWIFNTVGLGLMVIGFIIIIINKNRLGKSHFVTTHGKLGLSAIVISCVVAFFGILANNTRWLYPHVRPVLIKVGHAFGGIAMTILFIATIINGTYNHHFPGSYTGRSLAFTSFFLAIVIVLFKPILGAISRTRVLLRPPKQQNQAS